MSTPKILKCLNTLYCDVLMNTKIHLTILKVCKHLKRRMDRSATPLCSKLYQMAIQKFLGPLENVCCFPASCAGVLTHIYTHKLSETSVFGVNFVSQI